ncbi:hypothetical protein BSZ39_10020 [Bowdeniella nasicola]|uniref:Thioredoxin domain-containing protein n=1 Tax=Bowdeniella nasicola TaxID=208480 RepID=A0A1Q5Q0C5_9ACTO|nr:tetratricopeptide repeat protein [Bowdeniella nasicola]OKL53333.1 hypothetical protein BSZ39_10020 [Bowdeniella nasicola]
MSTPSFDAPGIVDLSALKRTEEGGAAAPDGAPDGHVGEGWIVDAGDAHISELMERSMRVPVVLDLWATWCQPCKQLGPILEKLAREYAGRMQLAKIDVDANSQLMQAFQVQSVPTVFVLIGGQPFQLFQGAHPESQLRALFDEMFKIAAQQGVTGTLPPDASAGEAPADGVPAEPEVPPLHREGIEAIERGDLAAAHEAFTKALKEAPADTEAKLALTQVELMQRCQAIADPQATLEQAGDSTAPTGPIDAQLAAADIEFAGGALDDALTRLLTVVRTSAGDEKETARARLVQFFDLLGSDPRVAAYRRQLAAALY